MNQRRIERTRIDFDFCSFKSSFDFVQERNFNGRKNIKGKKEGRKIENRMNN